MMRTSPSRPNRLSLNATAAAAVLLSVWPSLAWAVGCVPPAAPEPATKPAKPSAPVKSACVDKPTGPGCLGWEGYRYNDEVKAYNDKAMAFQKAANDYVAKLNGYVKAASDYAKCEVDSLR